MNETRKQLAEWVLRDELPMHPEALAAMCHWPTSSKAQYFDGYARRIASEFWVNCNFEHLFRDVEISDLRVPLHDPEDYQPTFADALRDLVEDVVREYMWQLTTDPEWIDPDDPFADVFYNEEA